MFSSNVSKIVRRTTRQRGGFSLIELVIVVVIIGIIGAIAIPRLSRGATGAADSALIANLAVLRNAIDLYATEHGGTYPLLATIEAQLVQYTDNNGGTSTAKDTTHIYGPYLRNIPGVPLGPGKGSSTFTDTAGALGFGWLYTQVSGALTTNTTTEKDDAGKFYSAY